MHSEVDLAKEDCGGTLDGARIGSLVGMGENGAPLVNFEDNPAGGPIAARIGLLADYSLEELITQYSSVVLVFENGDNEKPIIVGALRERSFSGPALVKTEASGTSDSKSALPIRRHLAIEAQDTLTLRCGKASITMRGDGKIVLYGTNIVSRATRVNKIKGGAVRIN
jgi:hypothetical protein